VRGGRQSRQLPGWRGHDRGAATAFWLRDQTRDERRPPGLLLRRIGSEFVERYNRHKGATDARRVLRTAASGHSLVFFPEGTFTPEVGLGKFHTGAFAIAARAACPVVPAVILGTRRNMPATRVFPRPGRIEVRYGAPIVPIAESSDADPALQLRDASRAAILAELGEPDLAA
jgi:1-acyl-sn-glycerol-3-phosphate acyltransferase